MNRFGDSSARPATTEVAPSRSFARLTQRALGQGLMEYGLILAFVSVLAIGALFFFGGNLTSLLGMGASAAP